MQDRCIKDYDYDPALGKTFTISYREKKRMPGTAIMRIYTSKVSPARAKKLSKKQRAKIASRAAKVRWKKK